MKEELIYNHLEYFMHLHFEKAMAQPEINFCKILGMSSLEKFEEDRHFIPLLHVFCY